MTRDRGRPPTRGFVERWVIALVIAFVFIPAAAYVLVPVLTAWAAVWFVTVPLVLLALALIVRPWRWLRRRR